MRQAGFFSSVLLLLVGAVSAFASDDVTQTDDVIHLAAPSISNLVEEDGTGYYQKILSRALERSGLHVKETFYPYKRALALFEQGRVDCIYSFTKVLFEKNGRDSVVASYPLGAFTYYLFARKSESVPAINELSGKIIGGVLGHDAYLSSALGDDVELRLVNGDNINLRLLELGRIDYMAAALPDMNPYLDTITYDPGQPLLSSFDRITCHRSVKNTAFIEKLSSVLSAMKESGEYRAINPELFLDFVEPL